MTIFLVEKRNVIDNTSITGWKCLSCTCIWEWTGYDLWNFYWSEVVKLTEPIHPRRGSTRWWDDARPEFTSSFLIFMQYGKPAKKSWVYISYFSFINMKFNASKTMGFCCSSKPFSISSSKLSRTIFTRLCYSLLGAIKYGSNCLMR